MQARRTLLSAVFGAFAATVASVWLTGRSRTEARALGEAVPPEWLPPARIVTVPGRGEMFFRDQPGPADGPTIVLLHGWVATADLNWFTSFPALSDIGRVIAPDHRGHGRGARHSTPFRLIDVADDVAALLRQEGISDALVVGYSMGGPVAQLLWHRHPDLVGGLVLCATAAHFGFSPVINAAWRMMSLYQFATRLLPRRWLEAALVAQTSGRAPVRVLRSVSPEAVELAPRLAWAVGEIQRGDVEDISEAGRELSRFDSREWLTGLDVPVAQILTTRDRLVPPWAQDELAGLLHEVAVYELAADHDAPSSHREEFNSSLRQAITRVLAAREARLATTADVQQDEPEDTRARAAHPQDAR